MIIAVIAGPGNEAALETRIKANPDRYIQLHSATGQWLIAAEGTAQELSDRLGITSDEPDGIKRAVVFAVAGYWGREPNNIWEWIVANGG